MSVDPNHALAGSCTFANLTLPDVLPAEPMETLMAWLAEAAAQKVQPNPNAMTLATVDEHGQPDARIVLARHVDVQRGFVNFYTNYTSAKGRELLAQPRAALVFHWDHLDRQVRIQGPVTVATSVESDSYFTARPVMSRVAAWASDQSEPLSSRSALLERFAQTETRFGVPPESVAPRDEHGHIPRDMAARLHVPRPPHWGGYRVWAARVELWLGHSARLHDRAVWARDLSSATVDGIDGYVGGAWHATRLQP